MRGRPGERVLDAMSGVGQQIARSTRRWPLAAGLVHVGLICIVSFALFDRPLARLFHALPATDAIGFFGTITGLGLAPLYLVPTGGAWIFCLWRVRTTPYGDLARRFRHVADSALYVFLSVALTGLLTDGLKVTIGRLPPRALFDHGLYGVVPFNGHWAANAFPSGHASTVFAAMTALVFVLPRYDLAWLTLAVLVALSRVVLASHYLSDVAMGSYIGVAVAIVVHRLFDARGVDVRLRVGRDHHGEP